MKHKQKGFTLVEVALFIAITGLLFAGIMVGTNNSIFQQRFTDSVQNFAEFLRSVYSEVSNPQSVGDGRSDTAIYGKLIVFGQEVGLNGDSTGGEQKIYVYDVIGDVKGMGTESVKTILKDELSANVAVLKNNETGKVYVVNDDLNYNGAFGTEVASVEPAGIVQSYIPRWGASIEKAYYGGGESGGYNNNDGIDNKEENLFKGSILVVRHPNSGTINTLVGPEINVNETINTANKKGSNSAKGSEIQELLISKLDEFDVKTVDFCVNPYGMNQKSDWRRDIRLMRNTRNASGVEIIDMDSKDNVCRYEPEGP